MRFEFDPNKSAANKAKHGIGFVEAQALWEGRTVTVRTKPGNDAERFLTMGVIDGRHWSAVWCDRGGVTRLISVRRSRKNEEDFYDRAAE